MTYLFVFVFLCIVLALVFTLFLVVRIFKADEGTKDMIDIANAVREGSGAYLRRQYRVSGVFFIIIFALLLALSYLGYFTKFVSFAFLTGGFFSGLAGFCGMKIATAASGRTANACRKTLNGGLKLAFSSGAVMGFFVVGLGLLDVILWYSSLNWYYGNNPLPKGINSTSLIINTMLTFGMGASFQALFARVGGGIFTKAADVGADLVGKVEVGIPEDDPRNPAVIADNVGDNVGDVAGMGADLYESYVGSIVATGALGVAAGLGINGLMVPMVLAGIGILASMFGFLFVRTGESATQKTLLSALRKGVFVSSFVVAIGAYCVVPFILGAEYMGIVWAIMSGLLAGILIGLCTEYYTSSEYEPTKKLARVSKTGPATVIIEGLSIGMMSTMFPVIIIGCTIIMSFYCVGGGDNVSMGLYGVGIAAVGMLSTLGITLATDAYGPVADNAGGNAQMAKLDPVVRKRTDALDSLGNTTAATGKGFAIGSAALTALALVAMYREKVIAEGGSLVLDLMDPLVLIGLFIGTMIPYVFSALTMGAVGRAAAKVVIEVREQFKNIEGLMEGKVRPNYAKCVDIATVSSLQEMRIPAVIAIATPIVVGLLFGVNSVGALLLGATISGFVLAVMMANAGGAWDNAKKYIEEGHLSDKKGSESHKASTVGDTVGDPFKDTSGPSINILIKLMAMVSIVFVAFILQNTMIH